MPKQISDLNEDAEVRQCGKQRRPSVLDANCCQIALRDCEWVAMRPEC